MFVSHLQIIVSMLPVYLLQSEQEKVRPLGCVVSLGTGRVPVVPRDHIDMFFPKGVLEGYKVMKGFTAFMELLVDQVSTNMSCIERKPGFHVGPTKNLAAQ